MKKIATLVGRDLEWKQPSVLKLQFELTSADEVAATLRFKSSFSSFATGESEDGCWTFKRFGFLNTGVIISACGSDEEVGTFRHGAWRRGGTLEVPGGRTYHAESNFWGTHLRFMGGTDETLIELKSSGMFHRTAKVSIHQGAARIPELPWMVMLGWQILIMMQLESETATVPATSGG